MGAAIIVPTKDGEVRISLHPVSLALVAAELIEDRARRRCRRIGHADDLGGYCERCGTSLPDDEERTYGCWLPTVYRSWHPRPEREGER